MKLYHWCANVRIQGQGPRHQVTRFSELSLKSWCLLRKQDGMKGEMREKAGKHDREVKGEHDYDCRFYCIFYFYLRFQ